MKGLLSIKSSKKHQLANLQHSLGDDEMIDDSNNTDIINDDEDDIPKGKD